MLTAFGICARTTIVNSSLCPAARAPAISRQAAAATLLPPCCVQVEFRYLSEITGDPKYAQKANKVFDIMSKLHVADGLFPIFFNPSSGKPVGSQARVFVDSGPGGGVGGPVICAGVVVISPVLLPGIIRSYQRSSPIE